MPAQPPSLRSSAGSPFASSPWRPSPIRPTRRSTSSPCSPVSPPRRSSGRSACRSSGRSTARRGSRACGTSPCSASRSSRSPSTTASTACCGAPAGRSSGCATRSCPRACTPELGALATPIGEVYRYTLEGAGGDPMKLRTLQDWVVRPLLMRVNGVADVVSYGGLVREIHVQPIPAQLAALRPHARRPRARASRTARVNASGGMLERGAEQFVIRSDGPVPRPRRHRAACAWPPRGHAVLLETWPTCPRAGRRGRASSAAATNDDAVEGIVLMRRGENPSVVLGALRAQIDAVERAARRRRRADRAVLRPHRARRHHARDGGPQPARGRAPGHAGALRLPARPARGAHRRARSSRSRCSSSFIYLQLRGMSRQPALDGRGRLRRHRRRRRW